MNVQIVIRGRQFNVRTVDNGDGIRRMAQELDRRLTEQAERSRSFDEHSVVVITALNLIGEIELLKKRYGEQLGELNRELQAVVAQLDALTPVVKK